jgi:hypothetical protein
MSLLSHNSRFRRGLVAAAMLGLLSAAAAPRPAEARVWFSIGIGAPWGWGWHYWRAHHHCRYHRYGHWYNRCGYYRPYYNAFYYYPLWWRYRYRYAYRSPYHRGGRFFVAARPARVAVIHRSGRVVRGVRVFAGRTAVHAAVRPFAARAVVHGSLSQRHGFGGGMPARMATGAGGGVFHGGGSGHGGGHGGRGGGHGHHH